MDYTIRTLSNGNRFAHVEGRGLIPNQSWHPARPLTDAEIDQNYKVWVAYTKENEA